MTPDASTKPVLLVALGGNAMIRKGQQGTIDEQFDNLRVPIRQIAHLSHHYRLIITHGNGPQVGDLMRQQECCDRVPKLPLEILVAQTEGQIGFMIESTLDEALMDMGIDYRPLISLITYVVVDEADPAFDRYRKPIGPVFSESEALGLPYPTVKTDRGYRRVVASPRPVTIVEKREIRTLIDLDFVVICCGGGGIPVVRNGRAFHGVDAVIDKDLASARLAEEVCADVFIIATDVSAAMLHYGTDRQTPLGRLTAGEARRYLDAGHFSEGSMQPKIEACASFIESGGKRAAICAIDEIAAATFNANVGTQFMPDPDSRGGTR